MYSCGLVPATIEVRRPSLLQHIQNHRPLWVAEDTKLAGQVNGPRPSPAAHVKRQAAENFRMNSNRPLVGVGAIVLRNGLVLLGQRLGSHGAGTWALPGGHLEFGESVEACALREVQEETGLEIQNLAPAAYTSDVFAADGKHYVTLFVVATSNSGDPTTREPEKCSGWRWYRWSKLPRPLFQPLATLHATGFVPNGAA